MSSELLLFIVVGAIAVAAAVMMLISDNAVHSALFLITTMGCIAFMFLMLNAPFLAMIQLTVYAGAIMVLFLFVIMLLGAERLESGEPGEGTHRYRWFTPLVLTLGFSLLFATAATILASRVNLLEPVETPPQVRVVNAVSATDPLTLYANDTPITSPVTFGDSTDYVALPIGDVRLSFALDGTDAAQYTLSPNSTLTLVAYGDAAAPTLAIIPDDLSSMNDLRQARFTVFNAYTEASSISLVDPGADFDATDSRVIIEALPSGQISPTLVLPEGDIEYEFLNNDGDDLTLYRLRDYELQRATNTLVVFAGEPLFDGTIRPVGLPIVARTVETFGSPMAIGYLLFTDYLFPFLVLALLLLAAMVGVIVLTHREVELGSRKVTGRRKVSRPLTSVIAAQVGQDVVTTVNADPAIESGAGD